MGRTFMNRRISKEVIALGIGGQIERGATELPPLASVQFQAAATVDSIKHKFLEDGTIAEITTLTIDKDTFRVVQVARAADQPELPLAQGGVTQDEADAAAAHYGCRTDEGEKFEAPATTERLLKSCEGCGHDHEGANPCPECGCEQYVPFEAPPTEETMEPVDGDNHGGANEGEWEEEQRQIAEAEAEGAAA